MLYNQCTQAPARDTDWRRLHHITKIQKSHYTYVTDLCRANRFLAVHPASRRSQEQTVADLDGQTTKKIGYCLDCLPPTWTLSHVSLPVLILGFFAITYQFYAHFILPIH